jgi:D-serine dehydratase
MREFLARTPVLLAPHGKTTMSPELFRQQLEDGAWGITVANTQQMRVARAAGAKRILLANILMGKQDIAYVIRELKRCPDLEFYSLVDSMESVDRLKAGIAALGPIGRPLRVLLEVGFQGGRSGCRDVESAMAVARAVYEARPQLQLSGVEGYEGLYQNLPEHEALPKVEQFLGFMIEVARDIDRRGLFDWDPVILSAGGSSYYDVVIRRLPGAGLSKDVSVVLRSGCYLPHDAGLYDARLQEIRARSGCEAKPSGAPQNALEIWCYVLSVPERGRAILGAGRRDFGHDAGPPVPIKQFRPGTDRIPRTVGPGATVTGINDQHTHLTFTDAIDCRVGDLVGLGISHPCTTFDKWRVLYVVNDMYTVLSAMQTFF